MYSIQIFYLVSEHAVLDYWSNNAVDVLILIPFIYPLSMHDVGEVVILGNKLVEHSRHKYSAFTWFTWLSFTLLSNKVYFLFKIVYF